MKNFLIIMFSIVLFCATIIVLELKYQTNDNFEYFSPLQIFFVFASFNAFLSTVVVVMDKVYYQYKDSVLGLFFSRKADINYKFLFIPFSNIIMLIFLSYSLIVRQIEQYQRNLDNYSSESPSETDV